MTNSFRSLRVMVVQGHRNTSGGNPREMAKTPGAARAIVAALNVDGTISMARTTPDSAIADFFICINDQPVLDFGGQRNQDGQGFAAFGQVIKGMDIVRTIQSQPADGQHLDPEVTITRIVIEDN